MIDINTITPRKVYFKHQPSSFYTKPEEEYFWETGELYGIVETSTQQLDKIVQLSAYLIKADTTNIVETYVCGSYLLQFIHEFTSEDFDTAHEDIDEFKKIVAKVQGYINTGAVIIDGKLVDNITAFHVWLKDNSYVE